MILRTEAAVWFEVVTTRKTLARAMSCLARTGSVELEAGDERTQRLQLADLDGRLRAWREKARRYEAYWPQPHPTSNLGGEPTVVFDAAWARLAAWWEKADPLIERLERLHHETAELEQLLAALDGIGDGLPPLDLIARAGPRMKARLFLFAAAAAPLRLPAVLARRSDCAKGTYLLVIGHAADVREVEAIAAGHNGTAVHLPEWLPASASRARDEIARRRQELADTLAQERAQLAELSQRHDLPDALGAIRLVEWFSEQTRELRASERLVFVTGWTNAPDVSVLRAALEKSGVNALVRPTNAPPGRDPPILMRNPRWARGFEALVGMLGTPTRGEADPSVLLAIIAPLLFGYMFGDVGQGLVIAIAGLILQQRMPMLRTLVPGGLFAALFGVFFGSVFAREDVIPALWLHPLTSPLVVLTVALASGALILALGLLLDAQQAHWRGAARRWWGSRAGLALGYAGLVASPLTTRALWLVPVGAVWFVSGAAAQASKNRLAHTLPALAEFVEQVAQLAINTISFARVGAFAIAHAGVSAAVVGIADGIGGIGGVIVMVLGNLLIIALEGLVVAIQTTRLLLFEFFARFLKGGGRTFKPLPAPEVAVIRSSATLDEAGTTP